MRAMQCMEYGRDPEMQELPDPPLGADGVRLEVRAAGVNFPDVLICEGKYQFRPDPPFTPGGEAAGVITELGPEVSGFRVGDRVIATTLWGGFASQMIARPGHLLRIPDTMEDVAAAGFALTYGTAIHGLVQRGALQPGETLVVTGAAGGVGLAAVDLGRQLGARVIAVTSSEDKQALCMQFGAEAGIVHDGDPVRLKEQIRALTDGRGADVAFDPVGGPGLEALVRSSNRRGRVLVVGFASGVIPAIPANLVLLKDCSLTGVFWGDFARQDPDGNRENFDRLFAMHAAGLRGPWIGHRLPLEQVGEAFRIIRERRALGKIVLEVKA